MKATNLYTVVSLIYTGIHHSISENRFSLILFIFFCSMMVVENQK